MYSEISSLSTMQLATSQSTISLSDKSVSGDFIASTISLRAAEGVLLTAYSFSCLSNKRSLIIWFGPIAIFVMIQVISSAVLRIKSFSTCVEADAELRILPQIVLTKRLKLT